MPTRQYVEIAKDDFEKAIEHLKAEYSKLQVGRANPALIEDIMVDSYGSKQPVKSMASISIADPRTIVVQPWNRDSLSNIEAAILSSGLNLTPMNDGTLIRINIPQLTEERRNDLKKMVSKLAEDARISIRNARQEAHEAFRTLKNKGDIGEDEFHRGNKMLKTAVDEANNEVEELSEAKEQDIMTI